MLLSQAAHPLSSVGPAGSENVIRYRYCTLFPSLRCLPLRHLLLLRCRSSIYTIALLAMLHGSQPADNDADTSSLLAPTDRFTDSDEPPPRLRREEFDLGGLVIPRGDPAAIAATDDDLPPSFWRRLGNRVARWARGPDPPKRSMIRPLCPQWQEAGVRAVERWAPACRARVILLVVFYTVWIAAFTTAFVWWKGASERLTPDYGLPVKQLSCFASFWGNKDSCGLNGDLCRPFEGDFAFRCPSNCLSARLLEPRAVGDQELNYRPFVIGGPDGYRGDSYICPSAIHAGVMSNTAGGCAVARRLGARRGFDNSTANYIASAPFDSDFPLAYRFVEDTFSRCNGPDHQWSILTLSAIFTSLLSYFCSSPSVFFYSIFIGVFIQIGLVSDPPSFGPMPPAELVSITFGRLLPALFCAIVLYKTCVRHTLDGLDAHIEKTVLWLGACWFGALDNYTLDEWIPVSRLTPHDIHQQPGAKAAIAILAIVLACTVVQQVLVFRREGRLLRYVAVYGAIITVMFVCAALPDLNLRIHHYIIGLLLLPGTSVQTRPSLLYQGLLVGLFINGVARWDFASVVETAAHLRNDGAFNSLLPIVTPPAIMRFAGDVGLSRATFVLDVPDPQLALEGVSVLVNDVERFHHYFDPADGDAVHFSWSRHENETLDAGNKYFRFGYLQDGISLDYTRAGVWQADGAWVPMEPGPS